MNATSTKVMVMVVTTGACWGGARAEETNRPEPKLQFEISDSAVSSRPFDKDDALRATHVAIFDVRSFSLPSKAETLLETSAGQSLSEKQKLFIRRRPFFEHHRAPGTAQWQRHELYAVSEADARKMAEAAVEYWDGKVRENMERTKENLAYYRKTLEEGESKLAELREKLRALSEQLEKRRGEVSYSLASQAQEVQSQMDEQLRLIEIDIAGCKAKLDSIQKVTAEGKIKDLGQLSALAELRVVQSVELAGLLARKKAAEGIRKQAAEFSELSEQKKKAGEAYGNLKKNIAAAEQKIPDIEARLRDPEKPVEILDNKVVIGKVQFSTEQVPQTQPSRSLRRAR